MSVSDLVFVVAGFKTRALCQRICIQGYWHSLVFFIFGYVPDEKLLIFWDKHLDKPYTFLANEKNGVFQTSFPRNMPKMKSTGTGYPILRIGKPIHFGPTSEDAWLEGI